MSQNKKDKHSINGTSFQTSLLLQGDKTIESTAVESAAIFNKLNNFDFPKEVANFKSYSANTENLKSVTNNSKYYYELYLGIDNDDYFERLEFDTKEEYDEFVRNLGPFSAATREELVSDIKLLGRAAIKTALSAAELAVNAKDYLSEAISNTKEKLKKYNDEEIEKLLKERKEKGYTGTIDYLPEAIEDAADPQKFKDTAHKSFGTNNKPLDIQKAEKELSQKLEQAGQKISATKQDVDKQVTEAKKAVKELENKKKQEAKPPTTPAEARQKLKTSATKQKKNDAAQELTFAQVAGTITEVNGLVNATFQTALAFGLKGEEALVFSNAVKVTNTVTSITNSIGQMLAKAANPMTYLTGGLSILANIGSLFGSLFGKKNEPSPEMQMLQKMYKRMEERFDQVMKGLEHLDTKLNELNEANQKRYEHTIKNIEANRQIMIEGFKRMEAHLIDIKLTQVEILRTADEIISIAQSNLYKGINPFNTFEEQRIAYTQTKGFNTFDDYFNFYDGAFNLGDALIALQQAINSKDPNYVALTFDKDNEVENKIVRLQIRKMYEPACRIFKAFYVDKRRNEFGIAASKVLAGDEHTLRELAANALLAPIKDLTDNTNVYTTLKREGANLVIDSNDAFSNKYYNYERVRYICELYLNYCTYFEIYTSSNDITPMTAEQYLSMSINRRKNRINNLQRRLDNLLDWVNIALAQQVLMSGHLLLDKMYYVLFHGTNPNLLKDITDFLNHNYLAAYNFACYLLHQNLRIGSEKYSTIEAFTKYYNEKNVSKLNTLMAVDKIAFSNEDDELYMQFDGVKIVVPLPENIAESKMAFTAAVDILLNVKQKIMDKKIDLEFGNMMAISNS